MFQKEKISSIIYLLFNIIVALNGSNLNKRQANACNNLSCLNGGSCFYYRNIATCKCATGYSGMVCEQPGTNQQVVQSNLCLNINCQNNGRCIQYTSTAAICFCQKGWELWWVAPPPPCQPVRCLPFALWCCQCADAFGCNWSQQAMTCCSVQASARTGKACAPPGARSSGLSSLPLYICFGNVLSAPNHSI